MPKPSERDRARFEAAVEAYRANDYVLTQDVLDIAAGRRDPELEPFLRRMDGPTPPPPKPEGPPYYPCPICGRWMTSMATDRTVVETAFDGRTGMAYEDVFSPFVFTAKPCGHRWAGEGTFYSLMMTVEWRETREVR